MKASIARQLAACVLLPCLGGISTASAQLTWPIVLRFTPPAETPVYAKERLAKAAADECFDGIGIDYPPINADGTCAIGVAKKNQAYVWGLAQAGLGDASFLGDEVWFGTIANPLCGGAAGVFVPEPQLTPSWVCEYGESELARRAFHPLPAVAGDWRLPRAYSYSVKARRLTDRTPNDANFRTLTGLRSAGSLGNAVFLAGPTFQNDVAFAAWDASAGTYLGSCRAAALNNIRQWITVNGVLYAAAGRDSGDGVILRWRGSLAQPFNGAADGSDYCGFEVVGVLPAFPAYVTSYDGKRLAASVWTENRSTPEAARTTVAAGGPYSTGVYIGPPFGRDGQYGSEDAATNWVKIWGPAQYEPDPVIAASVGGGAITFWKGYLWFGTVHNTSATTEAHSSCTLSICYGPPLNSDEQVDLLFNASRASSIWRARLTQTGQPEVELLYGETELPALVPGTKTWELKTSGWVPRYGKSGFDNPFLTYAWAASAGDNDLLFGMYDYRYVFDVRLGLISARVGVPAAVPRSRGAGVVVDPKKGYGADLWRFTATDTPAQAESLRGLGNFTNYGVRTMLRLDNGPNVILGTANGLNIEPDGGWELHLLTAPAARGAAKAAR